MKITKKQTIFISSMLFGMFFGAGNLIFPIHMGQLAGHNFILTLIGFIFTGVGLPMLGIIAFSKSKANSLYELSSRVSPVFGMIFTLVLYLTIGPMLALPRCATTSFTVGLAPLTSDAWWVLLIYSFVFFLVVMFFSLKSSVVVTWIGKIIIPLFLVLLFTLIIVGLINPIANPFTTAATTSYEDSAFLNGFLEGYNTMDAIASLAFGIVVVNSIKKLGVEDADAIASTSAKAGVFSCLLMGIIYAGVAYLGSSSLGLFSLSENGGIAMSEVCSHYFGAVGQYFLLILIVLACFTTSVGLVTSISKTFDDLFTKGKKYKMWVFIFVGISFLISNVGLTKIISLSVPVLMILYPVALVLILLTIFGKFFQNDRKVYLISILFVLVPAIFDGLHSFGITFFDNFLNQVLPLYSLGFGWLIPGLIGLTVALFIHFISLKKKAS